MNIIRDKVIFGWRIDVSFMSIKHYPKGTRSQWAWMYIPYRYIKGVVFRICGVYVNIREESGTEKLLEIAKNKRNEHSTGQ